MIPYCESHLATVLESLDLGFIATDTDGRIVQMNTVAERFTGWPRSEALGPMLLN